jgi:class 3 adenylate cyclase/tetratricopeptide (TPR) repeat protein
MHRLAPQLIIENYLSGNRRGHFKAASVYTDISGFSSITDALIQHGQYGTEVLARMIQSVFSPIILNIFNHGGFVGGFAGDSISAFFLEEVDAHTSALNALAAARAIQEELLANPFRVTEFGKFPISAKIGLGYGDVVWGIPCSPNGEHAVYYFRGSPVEDASDAEHLAQAGEIVLAKSIRQILGADVDVEPGRDLYKLASIKSALPAPRAIPAALIGDDTIQAFVPEILSGRDVPNEFRQAVNLLISFPERTDEELDEVMDHMFELQGRYGGLINHIDFGDKGCSVLVLWGAPVAYENDIGRALNFVTDLKAGINLPFTAGVTYYMSLAGYIGSELAEDYTCYGWGINLAARFMMSAPRGEIWIDERVAQRVYRHFDLEYVGDQYFKGFANKQKVFVLRRRKPKVESFFTGDFVGREEELSQMANFIAPLWSGNYAGMLTIWGDAGMGKSRLVYDFMRSVRKDERPVQWALCQADQIFHESFNPIRYWLLRYFDVLGIQDETVRLQNFQSKLDDLLAVTSNQFLADELQRTRSMLASLIDLHWEDSLYAQLDAQARYDNTIIAVVALLKAESLRKNMILIFEDAHYIDDDTRILISRLRNSLVADAISYPIAIIVTSRLQETEAVIRESLVGQELDLNRLSSAAVAKIAEVVLGGEVTNDLVEFINSRAEGNPFFTEQILRYLLDEKLIEQSVSGWALSGQLDSSALPPDISSMLIARLDQLRDQVKSVVQTASVLGREFEVQALGRMLQDDSNLHDEIVEAESASIWLPLNEIRYLFRNGLLRDAAYSMQTRARRQELHALALDALESLYSADPHHHYGELAYHSERAMLTAKARYYLRLAGDVARDSYKNTEALNYYTRALDITPPDDAEARFNLLLQRQNLFSILGDRERTEADMQSLYELALTMNSPENVAEILTRKSRELCVLANYQESIDAAQQALTITEKLETKQITLEAHLALAEALLRLGKYRDAVRECEHALSVSRTLDEHEQRGYIHSLLGLIYVELKDFEKSKSFLTDALDLFETTSNYRGRAMVLNNLALVEGYVGHLDQSFNYYEQSLKIARQVGHRRGEGLLLGNLGWIAGMLGNFSRAREYAERNLQITREVGDRYGETFGLINLSSHAGALGDFPAAREAAERALDLARESRDRIAEAFALTYLGHALFDSQEFEKAAREYRSALAIFDELNQPALASEPGAALARIALSGGDHATAEMHTRKILEHLDRGGTLDGVDQPLRIYLSCYLVLQAVNDPRTNEILNTAYEFLNARAANIKDETARTGFLENVACNREILLAWRTQNRQ